MSSAQNRWQETHKYDDIIKLPHPVSKKHRQMSLHDRAAQFAPFAALTGHSEVISDTAKSNDTRMNTEDLVQIDIL